MNNIEDIIRDIKAKIKNNPKYINTMSKEFQEDIKKYGFENGCKYIACMQQNGILKNPIEHNRDHHAKTYKRYKCNDATEYMNLCAQKAGYKDRKERRNEYEWAVGIREPLSEFREHHAYSGVIIAQKKVAKIVLPMILGNIKLEMGHNNEGFDFLMEGDIKVDVKSAKLIENSHLFQIDYNNIADYFFLVGFNHPYDNIRLDVMRMWLFKSQEMIIKGKRILKIFEKFYNRTGIMIRNDEKGLSLFKEHELKKELKEFKNICPNLED